MTSPTTPASQTEAFGLGRIGQIAVNAHDIGRATAFYRDTLGMKLLFEVPPKMSFFDCSGVRLMLSLPEKPEFDHPGSILYYKVGDIQATAAEMTKRGVVFESAPHFLARMPDHDLWMAFFRDSEGNFLGLMSEVAR